MEVNNNHNGFADEAEEIDIREILFKYLHYWKWILISLVSFLILGFVYIKISTPLYQVETDLLIKQDKNNPTGGGDDILKSLDLFSSDKIIDNEIQILKSYSLMEKIVKTLGLQVSYYQYGTTRKFPIYDRLPFKAELLKSNLNSYSDYLKIKVLNNKQIEIDGKDYSFNQPIQTDLGLVLLTPQNIDSDYLNTEFDISFNDLPDFYQAYSKNLTINPVSKEGTVLIITYQDAIPRRGKDILNRLVYEYNNAAVDDKNKVTAKTLEFIEDRLQKIAQELGTAEKNVQNYKSNNRITDISAQSELFMQSVQQNDADLGKVNIQLAVLDSLKNYIAQAKDDQTKLPSLFGIDDATLLGLVNHLVELQLQKQSLLQTVPETNPIVRTISEQINSLKNGIDQAVRSIKSGLLITQNHLQGKNTTFESVIKDAPSKERGLLDVMRQQDIKNALFTFLLQKREEQEMSLASNLADSRTIDVARSTPLPVKPVKPLVMILFFMFGLFVPISIIYLRGILNNKITKRADIEKLTRVPILAEIAHSDEAMALITVERPRSMISEQIRSLRTNLQFISSEKKHKVLLFTSGTSGEGKSFISLNLGASLAMSGKKVVILEFDLRKPKLHVALQIENDKGLSNYLISDYSYSQILKDIPQQENFHIITSGPVPPNPAELIANSRIESLITDLQRDFDYVIIDAPPVGLVTDAQILEKYANATIFIVRHNYTFKNQVMLIDELYKSKKFSNLNIVFNSIDYSSGGYGYGYGYGYGGGYYQENQPQKRSLFRRKK